MRSLLFSRPVSVACLALGVFALSSSVGSGTLLRLKLKAGQRFAYKATMVNKQAFGQVNSSTVENATYRYQVKSADANGASLHMVIGEVSLSAPSGGMTAEQAASVKKQMEGITYDATYDSRGRQKSLKSGGGSSMAQMMAKGLAQSNVGFQGIEYPQGPVDVGSKWTASVDMAKMLGSMLPGASMKSSPITVVYKLAGFTSSGGQRLAKIAMSMNGKGSLGVQGVTIGLDINGSGTMSVDVATGLPVTISSDTSTAITMSNGTSGSQHMKMNLKLVK